MKRFIAELRRRNVIRTTAYYLGAAWMLIGACDIFFPIFGITEAVLRIVIWALLAGIPIVLYLSWVFEFSSSGVVVDTTQPTTDRPNRKPFDLLVIAILGGALAVSVVFNLRQDTLFESANPIPLVAVVPFEDMSEVGGHISFGLAEELLNLLVREPGIRVVSSTGASELAQSGADLLAAARALNADFVVRGSVISDGNQLRVVARLVDVASGEIVWSQVFTGKLTQIFAAQYEIATNVADSLNFAIEFAFASSAGQLDPTAVDHYLRAKELRRTSSTLETARQAQEKLRNALTLQPDFSAALGELCRVHMAIFVRTEDPADFRQSDTQCRAALEADPESPHTKLALATLYTNAGQYEQARELAQQLTVQLPHHEPAYNQLGATLWRLNDVVGAEQAFRKAVSLQDRDWRPYLSLGNFYAQHQRYEDAITAFTKITELLPDDFVGYASLGVTHYEAGNYANAQALIERSLALNKSSRSYFNLGLIHVATAQHDAAAQAFVDSLALNPQNYRAQIFLSASLQAQGDKAGADRAAQAAITIIEGLVEVDPNNAYVIANGAAVLAGLGEVDRAMEWAERARSLNQDNPKTQFDIGLTYIAVGQLDKGVEDLVAALAMGYPQKLFIDALPDGVADHPQMRDALEANE